MAATPEDRERVELTGRTIKRLIDKRFKLSRRDMLQSGGTAATAAALTPTQLISGKAFAADPVAVSAESFATLAEMEPWYA